VELLGAATGPVAGTGSAAIWVAAIGALSLIAGALIPELFKLLRPKAGEEPAAPPPAVVTVAAYDKLEQRLMELATGMAGLKGEFGSLRHEFRRTRDVMESRDREHVRELEGVRDEVQRHRWAEHGIPAPRREVDPV
jgi:hypothetical protein